jgi:hypothetical protein
MDYGDARDYPPVFLWTHDPYPMAGERFFEEEAVLRGLNLKMRVSASTVRQRRGTSAWERSPEGAGSW